MNCMKCGREVALGQVFCKDCLADMKKYPVAPGTPVVLPNRSDTAQPRRTPARKARKPEEQVARLRKLVLWLTLALITVSLACGVTIAVLVDRLADQNTVDPGQNYSTEAPNYHGD